MSLEDEEEEIFTVLNELISPSAQRQIEDAIRMSNIENNMQCAVEHTPESFVQVHMLYVDCKVNGYPVKAFVDTGAQMSIMSKACAERCQILRLVDHRWAGIALGVGRQTILGRVHLCQIQIGNIFIHSSFSILEHQMMDMLLGLDMLRRHQCVLDLKNNLLEIGTIGTVAPFLAEVDLPEYARVNQSIGYDEGPDLVERLSCTTCNTGGKSSTKRPSTSMTVSSQQHAPVSSQQHAPVLSHKHVPVSSQQQAPVLSHKHAPVLSQKHAPVLSQQHAPVLSQQHAPVLSQQHAPVLSQQHAPVLSQQHAANFSEEVITALMSNGFSRSSVIEELRRCNGDTDKALAVLLSKSFSLL